MMVALNVQALFFILSAYGLATMLLYLMFKQMFYLRWAFASAVVTAVAFLTGSPLFVLGVIFMLAGLISQSKAVDKLAAYLLLLSLLPITWGVTIPGFFPDISFLMDLRHPLLLSFVIMLPLLVVFLRSAGKQSFKLSGESKGLDVLVMVYFLILMVMSFRNPTITSGLRGIVETFLFIFLPYLIFSRFIKKTDDFFVIFRALMFAVVLVGLVGVFSEVFSWNFYGVLKDSMLHGAYKQTMFLFRHGLLRIDVTMMSPIALGYFLVLGLFSLTVLSAWYEKRSLSFSFLAVLLVVPLIFTVSRGAWLMGVVYVALFFFFIQRKAGSQVLLAMCAVLGGVALVILGGSGFSDDTGTFDFRAQLIDISMQVFSMHPLLGDVNFRSNPLFDPIRLGDGFIDIVNTYIVVVLENGVIMLILFVLIPIYSMILLLKKANSQKVIKSPDGLKMRRVGVGLAAIIAASLLMFGTVSSVGYIPIYYWILVGLTVAYLNMVDKLQQEQSLGAPDE